MIDDRLPNLKGREIIDEYIRRGRTQADAREYLASASMQVPPPASSTSSTYTLGVAWSTYFANKARRRLWSLRFAYRAPSFFAAQMAQKNVRHPVGFLTFDDSLRADQLDGTQAKIQEDVEILYLTTHGSCSSRQYTAYLHGADWRPVQSGLGQRGPVVAGFDTCDLVDLSDPAWASPWQTSNIGPALRLILGFCSKADISEKPSQRGDGFAKEILAGVPFAEAWLRAVHTTSVHHQSCDYGIALALGDDPNDADHVLRNASLQAWPLPRSGSQIWLAWRCCH